MKFEIIVCEDDRSFRQDLIQWIECRFPSASVLGFLDGEDLLEHVRFHEKKRIVIVDIVLAKGEDGIVLAKAIKKIDPLCVIIFMSSFLEKACDVYEVEHCYFVYKPQKEARLEPAILKAIGLLNELSSSIVVHTNSSIVRLDPNAIFYLERIKRYTLVHMEGQTLKIKEDFEALSQVLPMSFHRSHRAFVVNFDHVSSYMVRDLKMRDGALLSVSRSYQRSIKEAFHQYLIESRELEK